MASAEEQSRTRCYWAILDTGMAFQYLDPLFQQHMREQSSAMIGKSLVDFIHPEEKQIAQEDFAKFKSSSSIFGSVTRCRYARVSHCREILGAPNVTEPASEGEGADANWIAARITSSLVANNTVLAFFHAMPEGSNASTANWNNCGPDAADISQEYMTPQQVELLKQAFTNCQNASEAVKIQSLKTEDKTPAPPNYVFQLLATNSDAIYFTWPPSQPTGDSQDLVANGPAPEGEERYSPVEYAALAKSVALPQTVPDAGEASTNCTKRYQSKHPVLMDGNFANVESVVITYHSLTFVCFQSGGILLNRNTFSTMPDLRVGDTNGLKRKDTDFSEDEAMKRLRTANMQHDDQDTPVPILDLAQWQNHVPQQGLDDGSGQQQQQFPNMPGTNTQIPGAWTADDPNNQNNLQSPYYGSTAYPSVYSNMFSNDGRTSGFMGGSTNIPPMPAPSQPSTSNGLQNLALASTSSYYSDYNPAQFNVDGTAAPAVPAAGSGTGNESPAGGSGDDKSMVIHRVRKNDRGRICTSCGTTNSPEWRKGPSGIKTLCNACGLRYSRAQARKAKKAAKEADPHAGANGASGVPVNNNSTNNIATSSNGESISTSYNIATPIQIPTSAASIPSGPNTGGAQSPYLPIGDYSVHAPLPPLPQPAHDEQPPHSAGSANGSGQNIPTGAGNGSYSNFVNYPYEQWGSPMYDQSFAAQQQQGQ